MDQKERSERNFHDKAFSEGTRESAWKFYAVTGRSRTHYEELVRQYAAAGGRALDYGCGRGANSRLLSAAAERVVAIDISDVALRRTRERLRERNCANVEYGAMNAESLGLKDHSFDLVCGKSVIHHLDLDLALPELARILKPDGVALFLEPLGHNPLINVYRRLTPNLRTVDEHPLKIGDLETARRYFGRVDVSYFTLFPLMAVPLRRTSLFESAVKVLTHLDQRAFGLVPRLTRYAWQVVVKLSEPKIGVRATPHAAA